MTTFEIVGLAVAAVGAGGLLLLIHGLRNVPICTCGDEECGGGCGLVSCLHEHRGRARWMDGHGWIAYCPNCRETIVVKGIDRG